MATVTDDTSVSLEKTRDILPDLFERNDTLWGLMKAKMDVEKVGIRAMRLPLKSIPSGKFRQVNLDGGDLGRGSAAKYINATISPVDLLVAVETTKKQDYGTDSKEKALFQVKKSDLSDAMWVIRSEIDVLLQNAGTGQIAVMSAGAGTTTWTLAAPQKAYGILEGQTVNCYTSNFATQRTTPRDCVVATVDIENAQITVDQAPGSHSNTDIVVIEGLSGANPVTLYGLPYHHSNSATGFWLGLDRGANPSIRTPAVNANGSNLTPAHVRLAINKSRMRLGVDSNSGEFMAWMHPAQEHAYEDIAQSQMLIIKQGGANEGFDPFYAVKTIAGIKIRSGLHAAPDRIDFLRLGDWGRAEMKPIDYVKWGSSGGDANYVLPIYGTSGGAAAAEIWYLACSMQIFNQNPRAGAYVYGLGVLAGY